VAEDFVDTTTPLKQLADAAMAPFGEHISQVSVKVTSEWRVTDTELPYWKSILLLFSFPVYQG